MMEKVMLTICSVELLLLLVVVLLDLLELPRQLHRIADYLERLVEHVTGQKEE